MPPVLPFRENGDNAKGMEGTCTGKGPEKGSPLYYTAPPIALHRIRPTYPEGVIYGDVEAQPPFNSLKCIFRPL